MSLADFRTSVRANGRENWLALLGLGIALSPTHTKIAGATWLLICIAGAVAFFSLPRPAASSPPDPAGAASRAWVMACAVCAVLATALWWYWPDRHDTLHAEFRLLLAALATHQLILRAPDPGKWRFFTLPATALACGAALLAIGTLPDKMLLSTNPIPWAVSVAFLVCIVLPVVMGGQLPATRRKWYAVAVGMGLGGVLLSQTRGAYGILFWALWLAAIHWRQTHAKVRLQNVAAAGLLGFAVLASSAWVPGDPLRLRKGWNEVVMANHEGDYNSSLGARVYLWRLGWEGFRGSPWIGIGGAERLKRIKAAGADLPVEQRERFKEVRNVGHVHNQYLHSAMDGGLLGLASTLAVLAGLGAAAFALRRADPMASTQLQGILFMHATASLSNVNLAHNYYAIMLSLSVTLVLAGAGARAGSTTQGG